MRPDRFILVPRKCVRVEFVGVQCAFIVIFDALSRDWVMPADGDLWQDTVILNWNEDVVRWDLGGNGGRRCQTENAFACACSHY
jgi:hypothetical protein